MHRYLCYKPPDIIVIIRHRKPNLPGRLPLFYKQKTQLVTVSDRSSYPILFQNVLYHKAIRQCLGYFDVALSLPNYYYLMAQLYISLCVIIISAVLSLDTSLLILAQSGMFIYCMFSLIGSHHTLNTSSSGSLIGFFAEFMSMIQVTSFERNNN